MKLQKNVSFEALFENYERRCRQMMAN